MYVVSGEVIGENEVVLLVHHSGAYPGGVLRVLEHPPQPQAQPIIL